jgi:hypothetical protein
VNAYAVTLQRCADSINIVRITKDDTNGVHGLCSESNGLMIHVTVGVELAPHEEGVAQEGLVEHCIHTRKIND